MAKVITVFNEKGGVGKTTLTMCLSGDLAHQGFDVLVLDCEPNHSACMWSSAGEDTVFPATVVNVNSSGSKIGNEIKKFNDKYDVILIDTPAVITGRKIAEASARHSDLVVVVTKVDPSSLKGSMASIELADELADAYDIPARIAVADLEDKAIHREGLAALADIVSDLSSVELYETKLRHLTAYQYASLEGKTIKQLKHRGKSAQNDIDNLCEELMLSLVNKEGGSDE